MCNICEDYLYQIYVHHNNNDNCNFSDNFTNFYVVWCNF